MKGWSPVTVSLNSVRLLSGSNLWRAVSAGFLEDESIWWSPPSSWAELNCWYLLMSSALTWFGFSKAWIRLTYPWKATVFVKYCLLASSASSSVIDWREATESRAEPRSLEELNFLKVDCSRQTRLSRRSMMYSCRG